MPRYLVQVAVLRPDEPDDELVGRIASLDHGEVRELDDVVNVWLHIDAPDRDAASIAVRAALEERLDPAERQLVLAVQAITTTR